MTAVDPSAERSMLTPKELPSGLASSGANFAARGTNGLGVGTAPAIGVSKRAAATPTGTNGLKGKRARDCGRRRSDGPGSRRYSLALVRERVNASPVP